jgi:hypothetical protein
MGSLDVTQSEPYSYSADSRKNTLWECQISKPTKIPVLIQNSKQNLDSVFDLARFPICKTLGFRKRKKIVDFQIISEFSSTAY